MKTIIRPFRILRSVFFAIGIVMQIGAIVSYQNTNFFIAKSTKAEGTIIDLEHANSRTYKPVVRFNAQDGEVVEFTSSVGTSPPSYSIGEKVEIRYLSNEPKNAIINNFLTLWLTPLIFSGIGIVFILIGGGFATSLFFIQQKERNDEYLKQYGTTIETELQDIQINRNLTVNRMHPYHIFTQWQNPNSSEILIFRSNNIWFDPSDYLQDRKITVFIDQNNPKNYYVDLSFLPEINRL
jgi:hypothetical protein